MLVGRQRAGASGEGVVDGLVLAHVGINAGRADAIHVDVIRTQLDSQRLDKAKHAMFSSHIMREAMHPFYTCRAVDTDDLPRLAAKHVGYAPRPRNPSAFQTN